jgi:hypothetical protein
MDSHMIARNWENGFKLIVHFVSVQNKFMRHHGTLPQRNMPEMWHANKSGMHGLTADDWLDLMFAWETYREKCSPKCDTNMLLAERDLRDAVLNDLDRFMYDMHPRRTRYSSEYKTKAWRFMMCLRETINEEENYDPFTPTPRFNELFE